MNDWRDTLQNLRRNFEAISSLSRLHSTVVEARRPLPFWSMKVADEPNPFWINVNPQNDPFDRWSLAAFGGGRNDPAYPRELSKDEGARAIPDGEKAGYLFDGSGNPLAVWEPEIHRSNFICGNPEYLDRFYTLADAAGRALISIPPDLAKRLPVEVQGLIKIRRSCQRLYVFGAIPEPIGNIRFPSAGWQPVGAHFEKGIVICSPESGDSEDYPRDCWILTLHQLGWHPRPGSLLLSSRWFWKDRLTTPYVPQPLTGWPKPVLTMFGEVPAHRFASILGKSQSQPTDLCMASTWGIDELLKLTAPAVAAPPPPPPAETAPEAPRIKRPPTHAADSAPKNENNQTAANQRLSVPGSAAPAIKRVPRERFKYVMQNGSQMRIQIQLTAISPDGSHVEDGYLERGELFANCRCWEAIERADDTHDEFLFLWIENGKSRWLKFRQDKQPDEYIHQPTAEYIDPRSRLLELKPSEAVRWFRHQMLDIPDDLKRAGKVRKPVGKDRLKSGLLLDRDSREFRFNGVPLRINAHSDFIVLEALHQAKGKLVFYVDLLRGIKPSEVSTTVEKEKEAPQEVKDAVSHIRNAFKMAGCTAKIKPIRGFGYRLLLTDQ